MGASAEQAHKKMVDRLRELGRVEARLEVGWGLLLSLALLVGMAGLALLVEAVAYLPIWGRLSVLGAFVLSGLGFILKFGLIPWVRRRSPEGLALKVEAEHPELKQRLIGALQLWPKRGFTVATSEGGSGRKGEGGKCSPSHPLTLSPPYLLIFLLISLPSSPAPPRLSSII
ncbi:MAG: hypothetical protein KAJ05_09455, partial [Candidatus Latescibacteria bacterium]|nr:hypothetical protein [Candidatus Latescibacterota bacterium]